MTAISANVPGLTNSTISGLPFGGRLVFRDRVEQAASFCSYLEQQLSSYPEGKCTLDTVDVANVRWPFQEFSMLIGVLQRSRCIVTRFMAFKCGLIDEHINCIGLWLTTVSPHNLPGELHLSNNSFTNASFSNLLQIVEKKRSELPTKPQPMWVRIENGRVEQSLCDNLVAQGRIVYAPKIQDPARTTNRSACFAIPNMFGYNRSQSRPATLNMATQFGQPLASVLPAFGSQIGDNFNLGFAGGGLASPMLLQAHSAQLYQQDFQAQACASLGLSTIGSPLSMSNMVGTQFPGFNAQLFVQPQSLDGAGCAERVDRSRSPPSQRSQESQCQVTHPWQRAWSQEHTRPYYWNVLTRETVWELPSSSASVAP